MSMMIKKNKTEESGDKDIDYSTFGTDDFGNFAFAQDAVAFNIQEQAGILNIWILLDSQSTVDVISNK